MATATKPQHRTVARILEAPTYEDLRLHRAATVRGWFAEHQAAFIQASMPGGTTVEQLVWARPGTRNYRVDYTCLGGHTLVVTGDLGEAIYQAGAASLQWWAGCDLSYFSGKCEASEKGRGYRDWDPRTALAWLREWVEADGDHNRAAARRASIAEYGYDIVDVAHNRDAWAAMLLERGVQVFGSEYYDGPPEAGDTVAQRCEAHLVGLKLAVAQLQQEVR